MARTTSPRFQISYVNTATRDEPADFPADMKRLVDAFENLTPQWAAGTFAARPAASVTGKFYYATDQQVLYYDTGSAWVTIGPMLTQLVPTGSMLEFAGTAAPAGYLLADGTSYTVASQTALHGVIGYGYGGSGLNFNVPNMKGRAPVGLDAAQAEFNVRGHGMGGYIGEKTHLLTAGESGVVAHSHTVNNHSHGGSVTGDGAHAHEAYLSYNKVDGTHSGGATARVTGLGANLAQFYDVSGNTSTNGHSHGLSINGESPGTNNAGPASAGAAHTNMPPYEVCNFIIKT